MRTAASWALLLTIGCGGAIPESDVDPGSVLPQPTKPGFDIDSAKARVQVALASVDRGRTALELLGLLPTYSCGEPRRSFVGEVVDGLRASASCVTVDSRSDGDARDVVTAVFTDCSLRGHVLNGTAVFSYSGGEDRLDLEADLRQLQAEGTALAAVVGYGTCSDETRYHVAVEGTDAKVDARVAVRDGMPVFGSTELILDGTGALERTEGTDRVTFTGLSYEMGTYLPEEGTMTIETASGHRVVVEFQPVLWRVGKAGVTVDGNDTVTVPIVR